MHAKVKSRNWFENETPFNKMCYTIFCFYLPLKEYVKNAKKISAKFCKIIQIDMICSETQPTKSIFDVT